MPTVEHSTLTTSDLHEPKGIDSANADEVYIADGSGSGDWQVLNPYGGIIYNDVAGSGTTFSSPSSYTLLNVVTAATNLNGFSTNNLGCLTYKSSEMRHAHAVFDMFFFFKQKTAYEITFGVYKNGSLL